MPKISNKDLKLMELAQQGGTDKDLVFFDIINEVGEKVDAITDNQQDINKKLDEINAKEFPETKIEFPETQKVKGKVEVSNFPEPPKVIEVSNLGDIKFPKPEIFVEAPSVQIPEIKMPEFPKEMKVKITNPQKDVMLVDEDDKPIDFSRLIKNNRLKVEVDRVGGGGGGGMSWNELIEIKGLLNNYAIQIDDVSSSGITYIGKAIIGSSVDSAVWQIKKLDETGSPITMIIKWADSNATFDNIWSNRTSLTYG